MLDIGPGELLLIAVVAIVVIGPKDLPLALRTAGRWVGRMRKISAQFRSGFDAMVREAEMKELEEKWRAQNEKIMREHPNGGPVEMEPTGAYPPPAAEALPPRPAEEPPLPLAPVDAVPITVDNPDEYRDMPASPDKPSQ